MCLALSVTHMGSSTRQRRERRPNVSGLAGKAGIRIVQDDRQGADKKEEIGKMEFRNGLWAGSHQYLTFSLAGEDYGIDILKVQEIKGYSAATRVPNSPAHVVGVINLRGAIVPIVDLR